MFHNTKTTNKLIAQLLVFAMLLSLIPAMSLTAWADTNGVTITFKSSGSSSDGTTPQDSVDTIIDSGASYVSCLSAAKVYNGKDGCGIKLGSSKEAGWLTLNLSSPMTVSAITVEAKKYNASDSCGLTIQDTTYDNVSDDFGTFTYTYAQPKEISSVALSSTGKRIYIKSVTLIGQAASAEPAPTAAVSPANSGTVEAVEDGDNWKFTATPASGYEFDCWKANDDGDFNTVSDNNPFIIDKNSFSNYSNFTAVFKDYATTTPVSYLDADGVEQSCATYTDVATDTDTWGTEGETTWYVVNEDVTIANGVTFYGDVHLILCDGATLTIQNTAEEGAGIQDGSVGASLTIYAQSTGADMGKLYATGLDYGIRGGKKDSAVTINGGDLHVNGKYGICVNKAALTINGGKVTATADGSDRSAGIREIYGGFTVSGGTIIATGGQFGIRIAERLTVTGGEITASGTKKAITFFTTDGTVTVDPGLRVDAGDNENEAVNVTETLLEKKWSHIYHAHSFTYTATGTDIVATCNGLGYCDLTNKQATLTIAADGGVYNGTTYSATVTNNIPAVTGDVIGDVEYYKVDTANATTGGDQAATPTDAGHYYASVTLTSGSNTYTAVKAFTVTKADPTAENFTFTAPGNLVYSGQPKTASVATKTDVKGMGSVTVAYYSDAACTTAATPTNVGTYYVGITVAEGSNYNAAETALHGASWQFAITKAVPVYATPTDISATYGDALGSVTLTNPTGNTPGTWSWASPTDLVGNAGSRTHKATFTPTDTVNNCTVSGVDLIVEVQKANPSYATPTDLVAAYGDTLGSVNLPQGWSWAVATSTDVGVVGLNTFKANFTPSDTANYNSVSNVDVTVAVHKANPIAATPTNLVATYGDTLSGVTLSNPTGNTPGTWAWTTPTDLVGNAGSRTHKATFIPEDTSNYKTLENVDLMVTVNKASFTPIASYGSWMYGETAGTGSVSVNPENGSVTWSYSTSQTGTYSAATPTNAGTYYAKATVGETANYNSATTAPVSFTISRANISPTVNITGWTYNNTPNQPTVSGNSGSGSVTYTYAVQGSDNYSAATPTNAGSYTVKAVVAQTTNYNAAVDTANFTIAKANLTTSDYTYATPTDLTYNGESKTATVTLKNGVNGAGEATVRYYSDASCTVPATPTDAGTYYVGISVTEGSNYNAATLHGNSWLFTIAKADFSPTVSIEGWTYGENANQPTVSGNSGNGAVTITYAAQGSDSYAAATPTNAGNYTVKAAVAETANYNAAVATANFTIAKADIHPTVSLRNWHEGSKGFEPEITGVMEDADVVYTYSHRGFDEFTDKKPTAAGRYTVKATVAATGNYNGAVATANFMILEDESSDLTVLSPLTTVTRVTMNGTVINSRYYTVSGGSVYFTEDFLKSLKPGVYTIKVTDGNTTATTTYRISGGEMGSVVLSATTADPGVALYAALAVSATLGLGYMGKKRKED